MKPMDGMRKVISRHTAPANILSEKEVWKAISDGLNAVIVNPTIILGPGGWNRGSSSFFPKIYSGLLFYTSGTNGYVDVNDVVKAMITLMRSNISGERFIIKRGESNLRPVLYYDCKKPESKETIDQSAESIVISGFTPGFGT